MIAKTCGRGHAFDERNTYVRPDGVRACRSCQAAATARFRERKVVRLLNAPDVPGDATGSSRTTRPVLPQASDALSGPTMALKIICHGRDEIATRDAHGAWTCGGCGEPVSVAW